MDFGFWRWIFGDEFLGWILDWRFFGVFWEFKLNFDGAVKNRKKKEIGY